MYSEEDYNQAFELKKQGLTYSNISTKMGIKYPATVYGWLYYNKKPRARFLKQGYQYLSKDLAYILGVIAGDGTVRIAKTKGGLSLEVKDYDFALEFRNSLIHWSGLFL